MMHWQTKIFVQKYVVNNENHSDEKEDHKGFRIPYDFSVHILPLHTESVNDMQLLGEKLGAVRVGR
jgi:hypothetical protein